MVGYFQDMGSHTFNGPTVANSPGPSGVSQTNNVASQNFPSSPVAKTPDSQCRGPGFDPWSGN